MRHKIKIDNKDLRILMILVKDARMSVSSIAKLTNMSREVVDYRLKKLEGKKAIIKYSKRIDYSNLNRNRFTFEIKFRDCTPEEEENIIAKIWSTIKIEWAAKMTGDWDYVLDFEAKDPKDFTKKLYKMLGLIGDKLKDYRFHQEISFKFHGCEFLDKGFKPNYKKILRDRKSFYAEFEKPRIKPYELDENDNKIIEMLSINSRIPANELAKKLHLDTKTVNKKIKNLIRSGIIVRFITYISYSRLGYGWYRVFIKLKNADEKRVNELKEWLKLNPNVSWSSTILGTYNMLFSVMTKEYYEFSDIVNEMRRKFKDVILVYRITNLIKRYKHRESNV